jgi:hypothetical protein
VAFLQIMYFATCISTPFISHKQEWLVVIIRNIWTCKLSREYAIWKPSAIWLWDILYSDDRQTAIVLKFWLLVQCVDPFPPHHPSTNSPLRTTRRCRVSISSLENGFLAGLHHEPGQARMVLGIACWDGRIALQCLGGDNAPMSSGHVFWWYKGPCSPIISITWSHQSVLLYPSRSVLFLVISPVRIESFRQRRKADVTAYRTHHFLFQNLNILTTWMVGWNIVDCGQQCSRVIRARRDDNALCMMTN